MITYVNTTIRKALRLEHNMRDTLLYLGLRGAYMNELVLRRPERVPICLAYDGTNVVAWAFLENKLIGVYTHIDYRRQGIGTQLFKRLNRLKNVAVSMHNQEATKFFQSVGAEYDHTYRREYAGWMVNGQVFR